MRSGFLHERGGNDRLAVAWQRPGGDVPVNGSEPIPGEFLGFRPADLQPAVPRLWVRWDEASGGNGHWYGLLPGVRPWTAADAVANRIPGAYLASLRSQAEQFFVQGVLGGASAWVGLTDFGSEGRFRWTSGEPVDFDGWVPGEPNNCCGGFLGEHYGQVLSNQHGRWNDLPDQTAYWRGSAHEVTASWIEREPTAVFGSGETRDPGRTWNRPGAGGADGVVDPSVRGPRPVVPMVEGWGTHRGCGRGQPGGGAGDGGRCRGVSRPGDGGGHYGSHPVGAGGGRGDVGHFPHRGVAVGSRGELLSIGRVWIPRPQIVLHGGDGRPVPARGTDG